MRLNPTEPRVRSPRASTVRRSKRAADLVADFGRWSAGDQLRAAERPEIDDGETGADVLEMKRLDQRQSIECDGEPFARLAAHRELGREVVASDARNSADGAIDVFTELRDRFDLLRRQRLRRREARLHHPKKPGVTITAATGTATGCIVRSSAGSSSPI